MGKTNSRQRIIKTTVCIIGVVCLLIFQKAGAAADDFKEKVAPIFEANCISCHGSKMQRSGLDLRSLEAVLRGGARGKIIVPGHPERSLLYKLITHAEDPKMPLGMDRLSDADIAAIAEWIRKLPPNAIAAATETGAPVRAPGYSITDKDRGFWSFLKPALPIVPAVKNRPWVRNEIDAFVLNRLEKEGLAPAPKALPRTL